MGKDIFNLGVYSNKRNVFICSGSSTLHLQPTIDTVHNNLELEGNSLVGIKKCSLLRKINFAVC